MGNIAINGKFLGAGLNGVHRTAAHYSSEILKRASAEHDVQLLTPGPSAPPPEFPLLSGTPVPGRFGKGQGWEMLTLPGAAKGAVAPEFLQSRPAGTWQ